MICTRDLFTMSMCDLLPVCADLRPSQCDVWPSCSGNGQHHGSPAGPPADGGQGPAARASAGGARDALPAEGLGARLQGHPLCAAAGMYRRPPLMAELSAAEAVWRRKKDWSWLIRCKRASAVPTSCLLGSWISFQPESFM